MRQQAPKNIQKVIASVALTALFLSNYLPVAQAQVNQTINTTNPTTGTYYNTTGNWTTFTNNSHIHVTNGTTLTGHEVNGTGGLTGNGGSMAFNAPFIRIDGTINVNSVFNGGLGGNVRFDSQFVYQNGQIYANGSGGGGSIQFNTGSAVFAPCSVTEARGLNGSAGGHIGVNATGIVDVMHQAVLDTTGRVMGNLDNNKISIDAGMINIDGILRANGVSSVDRAGTIRLVTHGNPTNCFNCGLDSIRAVVKDINGLPLAGDMSTVLNRTSGLVDQLNNSGLRIGTTGKVHANGLTDGVSCVGVDGGTIHLASASDIIIDACADISANGGNTLADNKNGGNGGLIVMTAMNTITNKGAVTANGGKAGTNGVGGKGGIIGASYGNTLNNTGLISAQGGNGCDGPCGVGGDGGLIVLQGSNPSGNGTITAKGGHGNYKNGKNGTIAVNNPATVSGNTYIGTLDSIGDNEVLVAHGGQETVLLSRSATLSVEGKLAAAKVRSVDKQTGGATINRAATQHLIAANTNAAGINVDLAGFNNLNTATVLSNSSMTVSKNLTARDNISLVANESLTNNATLKAGSINATAVNGNLVNNGTIQSLDSQGNGNWVSLKANGNTNPEAAIINNGAIIANGGALGGSVRFAAAKRVFNAGSISVTGSQRNGSIQSCPDIELPPPGDDPELPPNYGLFQDGRYIVNDSLPIQRQPIIAEAQPSMLLSSKYKPVTQEILTLAMNEYSQVLGEGFGHDEAMTQLALFLKESGITDPCLILNAIDAGQLTATEQVQDALYSMAQCDVQTIDTLKQ